MMSNSSPLAAASNLRLMRVFASFPVRWVGLLLFVCCAHSRPKNIHEIVPRFSLECFACGH